MQILYLKYLKGDPINADNALMRRRTILYHILHHIHKKMILRVDVLSIFDNSATFRDHNKR